MDFTELDNWLGTLEELQLGLGSEKSGSTTEHVNKTFLEGPLHAPSYRISDGKQRAHLNLLCTNHTNQPNAYSNQCNLAPPGNSAASVLQKNCQQYAHSASNGFPMKSNLAGTPVKDGTTDYGLNTLLRDLEAVEERTRKLEQGSDTFTRRYSLASSPKLKNNHVNFTQPTTVSSTSLSPIAQDSEGSSYISAQWVAELNRRDKLGLTSRELISSDLKNPMQSPPIWLGAGDACLTPSSESQPTTPMKLVEQSANELWFPNQDRIDSAPGAPQDSSQQTAQPILPVNHLNSASIHRNRPLPDPNISPTSRPPAVTTQYQLKPAIRNSNYKAHPTAVQHTESKDVDDDSSLSGISSWEPGPNSVKRDLLKSNSLVYPVRSCRLSNSMSPESSLSDKSLPERTDSDPNSRYAQSISEGSPVKKLIIRIFRPDKTTKAILIDESMTAGEVASVLIEKNFLPPSISLSLVEKVPGLKVERIFEEHENVAECIMAWTPSSQNMLFFEERFDQYGFIESPKHWLTDGSCEKQPKTTKAIQTMLRDIEQTGFPEWRDHLYLRKAGDKAWTRKLCVLRSSGIYVSRKNRLQPSSSDLKRIVPLDNSTQLYTTTGGWTRLQAPTPHGFIIKPYSAQDNQSKNVFCFCATDEKSFRQWICRIRMAKYGKQLYINYHDALKRVEQCAISRNPSTRNGSLNGGLLRRTSFDSRLSSTSSSGLTSTESGRSLSAETGLSPPALRRSMNCRTFNAQRMISSSELQQI